MTSEKYPNCILDSGLRRNDGKPTPQAMHFVTPAQAGVQEGFKTGCRHSP
jgi:hypothetical protein